MQGRTNQYLVDSRFADEASTDCVRSRQAVWIGQSVGFCSAQQPTTLCTVLTTQRAPGAIQSMSQATRQNQHTVNIYTKQTFV